ncbi:BrnT family toxin [Phormidesmis sp. 146-33]
MNFEWDERKNEINIDKHGFDFADAYRVFALPMAVELDERDNYGEDRWIGTGMLDERVVGVIYTEPDAETIRIKALTHERRYYEQKTCPEIKLR